MSNAPRTESLAQMVSTDSERSDLSAYHAMYAHATELEGELAAANAELAIEKVRLKNTVNQYGSEIRRLLAELATLRAAQEGM